MSTEFWGNMPKDQGDPEKPEEMAERVVQEHDDDPDAHLDEGQSLKSHRASEIIDHIARSIVGDKINALDDAWEGQEEGIITAFDASHITDSSKAWEVNEWVDHWVYVLTGSEAGTFRQITANTATVLTFVGGAIPGIAVDLVFIITKIKYFGDWHFRDNSPGAYNNRVAYTSLLADYFEYSFIGNRIVLYMSKLEDSQDIQIYIDDVLQDTVSLNSIPDQHRFAVWEMQFETIPETPRVLKIVNYGDGGVGNHQIQLEAIDVNGVVAFSSLNLPLQTVHATGVTDVNGDLTVDVDPPAGYYFIGFVGIKNRPDSTDPQPTPTLEYYLYRGGYRVKFKGGAILTPYGVELQLLLAKKDPYVEV